MRSRSAALVYAIILALFLAPAVVAALGFPVCAIAAPSVVDTISIPGGLPSAAGVYEAGNKVFVADSASGASVAQVCTPRGSDQDPTS